VMRKKWEVQSGQCDTGPALRLSEILDDATKNHVFQRRSYDKSVIDMPLESRSSITFSMTFGTVS
jgi:hypothetical protein